MDNRVFRHAGLTIARAGLIWSAAFLAMCVAAGAEAAGPGSERAACAAISYQPLTVTVPACTRLMEGPGLSDQERRNTLRRQADAYFYGAGMVRDLKARRRVLERALADIDRALSLPPAAAEAKSPPYWLGPADTARGELLYVLGRFEQSVTAYGVAIEARPRGAVRARFGRAQALARLGRHDAAIADLSVLVARAPDRAAWRFERAKLHEKAGNAAAAMDDYRATLKLQPGHVSARGALEKLEKSEKGGQTPN